MTDYWRLVRDETDVCVLFEKSDLGKRIAKDPLNPISIRNVFNEEYEDASVPMVLSGRYKQVPPGDSRWSVDVVFFGWITAFSEQAHQLLIAHGCSEGDFVPCHFTLMPGLQFHSFLPRVVYDVVDIEQSKFHMILPMTPPLPAGIGSLALRASVLTLPESFYAKVPGYEMIFSELLVSDSFRADWVTQGLTGAAFKEVAAS